MNGDEHSIPAIDTRKSPADTMGNASDEYVPDIAALSLASRAVHADARIDGHPAIAPGLHTSTTFRYPNDPETLKPIAEIDVS